MPSLTAIFAGVSERYLNTSPRGWGGDPSRGAALGRRERQGDSSGSFALSLRKIPLDADGYDPAGTYFGRGAPLYNVSGEDASGNEVDFTIRAYDREHAREKALARYPNAKIRK